MSALALHFGPRGLSVPERWALSKERGAAAAMYEKIHPVAFHHIDALHAEGLTGGGEDALIVDLERKHAAQVKEVLSECAPGARTETVMLNAFLEDASRLRARVVNLSIDTQDEALRNRIVDSPETLFVLSAGNGGRRVGVDLTQHVLRQGAPGHYEMQLVGESFKNVWSNNGAPENVLLVAYTTPRGALAKNASDPKRSEALRDAFVSCLGEVTMNDGKDAEGSSLAAPVVSAAALLVMQAEPSLTAAQVRAALVRSARGPDHVLDAPRALVYARMLAAGRDPSGFEREVAARERKALDAIRSRAGPYITRTRERLAERLQGGDAQLALALQDPRRPFNVQAARAAVAGGASLMAWLADHTDEIDAMEADLHKAVPLPMHAHVGPVWNMYKAQRARYEAEQTALPLLRELANAELPGARPPKYTRESLAWALKNWFSFACISKNFDAAQVASLGDLPLAGRLARLAKGERGARLLAAAGAVELKDLDDAAFAVEILRTGAPGLDAREVTRRVLGLLPSVKSSFITGDFSKLVEQSARGDRAWAALEGALEAFVLEHPLAAAKFVEDGHVSQDAAERVMRRFPDSASIVQFRLTGEAFFDSIGRPDLADNAAASKASNVHVTDKTFPWVWANATNRFRAHFAKALTEAKVGQLPSGAIAADVVGLQPKLLDAAHRRFPAEVERTAAFLALPAAQRLNMQARPDPAEALAAVRSGDDVTDRVAEVAATAATLDDALKLPRLRRTLRGLAMLVEANAHIPFLAEVYDSRVWPADALPPVERPPSITLNALTNFIGMDAHRGAFVFALSRFDVLRAVAADKRPTAHAVWNQLADAVAWGSHLGDASTAWWGKAARGTVENRAGALALCGRFSEDGAFRLTNIATLRLKQAVFDRLAGLPAEELGNALGEWIAPTFARLYGNDEAAARAGLDRAFADIPNPMRPGTKFGFAAIVGNLIRRMKLSQTPP